ncbi:MAG: divalent-cation tolerance protein CutA [Fluviibacter sp.]
MAAQLIFTTAPDTDVANDLTHQLVALGLAACVKQLAPCQSTYRWQGQIENTTEIPLIIISDNSRYAELEAWLKAAHPYDLPEIIALPCTNGLPEYLRWVNESTRELR